TEQHLAPLLVGSGGVELTDIDAGFSAVGVAVVDGYPERGAATQLEIADLLAEVEADPVGQKAHLHPRLAAIELLAITLHVAVDVEGVEVAVGGKGGVILIVEHDFGDSRLAHGHGYGTGQSQGQQG